MWLLLAFLSAALLGCYDTFKKRALANNAVLPVLFLNTVFSSLLFLPLLLLSMWGVVPSSSEWFAGWGGWHVQQYIVLKSFIVLGSWMLGYFGMKHLPLTLVGPINATRPVLVLLGAMLVFGERLNAWQWAGVLLALVSFVLLSRSGQREGIDFRHNRWIFAIVGAAILGAVSGLYDKYLMASPESGGLGLSRMTVQSWYNLYQMALMFLVLTLLWWPKRHTTTPFRWRWAIVGISVFLSAADFAYFFALSQTGALISVVSMVRRGSVLVSFLFGVLLLHERNVKSKAIDLLFVLLGMICLYLGSV